MALFPALSQTIKGRVLTTFPVTVTGDNAIAVSKDNGIWTITQDWSTLDLVSSIDITNAYRLLIRNPDTDVYYETDLDAIQEAATQVGPGFTLKFTADLSATADADPGSGKLRFNNATQSSATVLYVDDLDILGVDISGTAATIDDASNTIKGQLSISKAGDASKRLLAEVTSITDAPGYTKVAITIKSSSSSNPFVEGDTLLFGFVRSGDSGSGNVSAGGNIDDTAVVVGDGGGNTDVQNSPVTINVSTGAMAGVGTLATSGKITTTIDDATNNGVTVANTLTHTTSGSPSAGIGVSQTFVVETSADNNEVGMEIQAVTSDVTLGSEDFSFVVKLMAAGAAVAEMLKLTSVGVLTLAGSAAKIVLHAAGGTQLTGGFTGTSYDAGTKSSGTFTPDALNSNIQHCVNGGAFTLGVPTNPCSIILEITNNGSAGAITTTGYVLEGPDVFNTTNGKSFRCVIVKTNGFTTLGVKLLN